MSWGAAIVASLMATIAHPAWWPTALAGFLVRGGIVLFILPIVALPSPLAMSTVVTPFLTSLALGRTSPAVILVIGGMIALVAAWIVVGGWFAAAIEVTLVRSAAAAAADDGLSTGVPPAFAGSAPPVAEPVDLGDRHVAARVLGARLLSYVPFAMALAWGGTAIVAATYVELTSPGDVATPLALRVIARAALPVAAVVVAWVLSESIAGIAARRVVLRDAGTWAGVRGAVGQAIRSPLTWLATTAATFVILLAALVPILGAASVAWGRLRSVLVSPADGGILLLDLAVFLVVWFGALLLAGVLASFRSATWTYDVLRRSAGVSIASAGGANGTFGVPRDGRPGDLPTRNGGGSL